MCDLRDITAASSKTVIVDMTDKDQTGVQILDHHRQFGGEIVQRLSLLSISKAGHYHCDVIEEDELAITRAYKESDLVDNSFWVIAAKVTIGMETFISFDNLAVSFFNFF